jgi:hypothetical protein
MTQCHKFCSHQILDIKERGTKGLSVCYLLTSKKHMIWKVLYNILTKSDTPIQQ